MWDLVPPSGEDADCDHMNTPPSLLLFQIFRRIYCRSLNLNTTDVLSRVSVGFVHSDKLYKDGRLAGGGLVPECHDTARRRFMALVVVGTSS